MSRNWHKKQTFIGEINKAKVGCFGDKTKMVTNPKEYLTRKKEREETQITIVKNKSVTQHCISYKN